MKRVLTVLMMMTVAQMATAQWLKPNNSYGIIENRRTLDSTLLFPTGCGAPSGAAGLKGTNLKKAAIYYDSCAAKMWVFDPKNTSWDLVGSTGNIDSLARVAISATNGLTYSSTTGQAKLGGTLNQITTIEGGGNPVFFNNLGAFEIYQYLTNNYSLFGPSRTVLVNGDSNHVSAFRLNRNQSFMASWDKSLEVSKQYVDSGFYMAALISVDSAKEALLAVNYPSRDADSLEMPALDPLKTTYIKAFADTTDGNKGIVEFYGNKHRFITNGKTYYVPQDGETIDTIALRGDGYLSSTQEASRILVTNTSGVVGTSSNITWNESTQKVEVTGSLNLVGGGIVSRQADGSFITAKPAGDSVPGVFQWVHNGASGYLFHLISGRNMAHGAMIGVGVGDVNYSFHEPSSSTIAGFLASNKRNGMGFALENTDSSSGIGFYGVQNGAGDLFRLSAGAGATGSMIVFDGANNLGGSAVLMQAVGLDQLWRFEANGRLVLLKGLDVTGNTFFNSPTYLWGGAPLRGLNQTSDGWIDLLAWTANGWDATLNKITSNQQAYKIKASNPTSSDIADGYYQIYKNSSSGDVKLWVNDGGTLKSVLIN